MQASRMFSAGTKRRTHKSLIAGLSLLAMSTSLSAAILDLGDYPYGTPISEVNEPGFTFVLSPSVSAIVTGPHSFIVYNAVEGSDFRILFDGSTDNSHVYTAGNGSCQQIRDYVSWYLADGLIEQFDTYDSDASDGVLRGRCESHDLTRDFDHDEIRLDIATDQSMIVSNLFYGLASDIALVKVTKTFADAREGDVEVTLTCNTGLPLKQSKTIAGGDPEGVTFTVTNIPDSGADCEVTETSGPANYTASYISGNTASSTSCAFDGLSGSWQLCNVYNSPDDATYTVVKDWVMERSGGDVVDATAEVTISCNNFFQGSQFIDGQFRMKRNLGDGDSVEVKVPVFRPAICSASENIAQSGVESLAEGCGPTQLGPGDSHTCTFTNTVFFEGIPTLSQHGLALLALLMLGVGFVGIRRFA